MKLSAINEDKNISNIIYNHLHKYKSNGEPVSYKISVDDIPIILNIVAMDSHPDKDYFMSGVPLKIGGNAGNKITVNIMYDYSKIKEVNMDNILNTIKYVTHHEFDHPKGDNNHKEYHVARHELEADANAINKLKITSWDELKRIAPHLPFNDFKWRKMLIDTIGRKLT